MSTAVRSTPHTRSQTRKVIPTATRSSSLTRKTVTDNDDIPKKLIILTIIGTVAAFCLFFYGFFKFHKRIVQVPKLPTVVDRLVYTIQLQTFSLLPLSICLIQVMFTRLLTNARNPLSGNESFVEKPVRILTNTLEQFIFNVANQLILATYLPAHNMHVIPFFVFMFTFGRIAFMIGYNINPKYRTFGFTLTFLPSFLLFNFNLLHTSGMTRFISMPTVPEQTNKKIDL